MDSSPGSPVVARRQGKASAMLSAARLRCGTALLIGGALLALCGTTSAGPGGLCTECYNPVRPGHVTCKDNGCDKQKSEKCNAHDKNGDKYLDTCYCGAVPKKKKKGVRAEATGGTVLFDGSTLIINGVEIVNIHHLPDATDDPADPVVNGTIMIPPLVYAGPSVFFDGVWQFDYHRFVVGAPGSQLTVVKDGGTLLSAQIAELWYITESNAFSIGLGTPVCDLTAGSSYLDTVNTLTQDPDPDMYLWISVSPQNDFALGSSLFTNPYMDEIATTSLGVTGTAPAVITILSSPIAGVPIAGDLPGVTNYTTESGDLETITLSALPTVARIGRTYYFAFWVVDDEPMPPGETDLQVGVEADHTVMAVYDWRLSGDANDDCVVNVLDLIYTRNRIGTRCPQ